MSEVTLLADPFAGLAAFVRSVDAGGFSAAARALGTTPSAVSKSVARLERRLGARLVQRSTRALRLTGEGEAFYAQAKRLLAELDEAQRAVREGDAVRGRLRVSAPLDLGRHWLMPRLAAFSRRHPELRVELGLTDRFVDLIDEGVDVALRMGDAGDARLVRRKLGVTCAVLCASPGYVRERGEPARAADLSGHAALAYLRAGRPDPGLFRPDGPADFAWSFGADNNESLRLAALAGLGVARLPRFMVEDDIKAGRLVPLLPGTRRPAPDVFAAYPEQRPLPPRVRAFVDFLVDASAGGFD